MRSAALAATALTTAALATAALFPGAAPSAQAAPGHRAAPAARAAAPPGLGPCGAGQLCLWARPDFTGGRTVRELGDEDVSVDSCIPLAAGRTVQSLANRTGRPVTTYQSPECAETGEFQTYPGDGVWLPRSPYQVRAFKIWEN
ncbi:peptidase inhibitor family I36 protein [Streptomyces bambusae]|uniref:peptidase inhibitor family I36 protein n=1 Tax=Streptomyces bambusae TaxID=1550616 RepID=UPI001CFEDC66|nr:peptidase inhibitor family I36 protein [Streptomyces bambusae]MCB5164882.1 peptidase inhibitor family I36 protein [Streptomyces bambusae]